jgi:Iap family predicted aminopeptidase
MPAEARIKDVFTISGRGTVLMIEPDFTGRIHLRDTVTSSRGQAIVLGVEVATNGCVGVLVDIADAREVFRTGDPLRFDSPADAAEP